MSTTDTITAQVRCILRNSSTDPCDCITHIGGLNADGGRWRLTVAEAIAGIEARQYSFFVQANGRSAWVVVAVSAHGRKYLKTEADNYAPNNLLSLPSCV